MFKSRAEGGKVIDKYILRKNDVNELLIDVMKRKEILRNKLLESLNKKVSK